MCLPTWPEIGLHEVNEIDRMRNDDKMVLCMLVKTSVDYKSSEPGF